MKLPTPQSAAEYRKRLPRKPRVLRGTRLPEPIDASIITTARLRLRPYLMEDFHPWLRMHRQPQTTEYLHWPDDDLGAIREHLRARTRHTRLWQADDFMALAIESEGELAGEVSLHLRSVRAGTRMVEVGWVLERRFTGRGLATEATAALLDFAFDAVGARIATAVIDPENVASIAVAERLGFQQASTGDGEHTYALLAGQSFATPVRGGGVHRRPAHTSSSR
ncbi:GNAT family N-acetyltransferase [Agromyces aerolatus]|uniref:GNAT family N-acetyltransferase n=1 Tax=Agromyces sp. LY-1074 TaxID=3074080 RepID=UPI00285F2778|nr:MULTISPECIES: GNAT family N-acetyltransferase [unclassified Agromyces]MDR5699566.1 GNAT family N-acetyltransferase [Agromyces sp. LY-1074]MDR5705862.1 GNAT family N-acetyltransferase [Agromyces sp. LY-1358]